MKLELGQKVGGLVAVTALVGGCGTAGDLSEQTRETRLHVAANGGEQVVLATMTAGDVTFRKLLGADGAIFGEARDRDGNVIDADLIETAPAGPVGEALRELLEHVDPTDRIDVAISLRDDVAVEPPSGYGEALQEDGVVVQMSLGERSVAPEELEADRRRNESYRGEVVGLRRSKRAAILEELSTRAGWALAEEEVDALADANGAIHRSMLARDVPSLLASHRDLIGGIDLHDLGDDQSLASAMAATAADPGALQTSNSQGAGIGVYLTEGGCPPAEFLSNYTKLGGSNTDHSRNTTSILRAVSPSAWIYCRGPAQFPTATELLGSGGNPQIHLVSRSQGSVLLPYYDSLDRDCDDFIYNNQVLHVNAAGNVHGNEDYPSHVVSPGKALNALTVGNYDDSNDTIYSTSSRLNPTNTRNQKPELSAPGVNITAGNVTDTGTSMSTAHVSGLLADHMQAQPWLRFRPYLLKAHAIAEATDPIAGGRNAVGEGGIDFLSGRWTYYYFWVGGSNSYFDYLATHDAIPNNNTVDKVVNLPEGVTVQAVVAWTTRGSYTHDHRTDLHPIGTDLDLTVYGPNGATITYSSSWNNPYEVVRFVASTAGPYRFSIHRYANRDTDCRSDLGLTVNYH